MLETPLKQLFASPVIASAFLVVNGSILFLGEMLHRRAGHPPVERQDRQPARLWTKHSWEGLGLPAERRAALGLSPRPWEAAQQPSRALAPSGVLTLTSAVAPAELEPPAEHRAQGRPLAQLGWQEAALIGLAQSLALIPGISRSGVTMVAGLGVRLSHEDAARFSFLLGTPLIGAAALLEVPQLFGQSASTLLLVGVGMVLAGVAAYLSTRFLMRYFQTGRLDPFAWYCWGAGLVALIVLLGVLHAGA